MLVTGVLLVEGQLPGGSRFPEWRERRQLQLVGRDARVGADTRAHHELHHLSCRVRIRNGRGRTGLATVARRFWALVDEIKLCTNRHSREVHNGIDTLPAGYVH